MGGLITTAARLKDDTVVSFRHYTNNDFNLVLRQDDFIKEMKKISPSIKTSPKRKYMKLSRDDVIDKFERRFSKTTFDYVCGNSFLAPVWYGINFFDYRKNVAFSVNDFSSNLHFLTYNLMSNPIVIKMLKEGVMFTESDLVRLSHNVPFVYLRDILKLKELKDINALYDENGEIIDLKGRDTFDIICSFFDDNLVKPEYFKLRVKYPDWDFYSHSDGEDGFDILKDYLEKENLLTKNDKIAWGGFESNMR
ncbi:hypothetical protein ECA1660 [Pectobacterium atrosepticum SCRI1043]|uniref:Uncharacterized protein n=1 Tax=Pectobacterium atrosepticum (strain SCRI 1043 / ATCC BAA-672) TaxID=218491 RepID=Q6D6M2_PECAS|nr:MULTISPECIES: hypothetical protein [Pectobacterium]MCA6924813.1 hypothetical protein [Pectobacterium versatile]MCH5081577.1 hypothetical protein [Pectobacterium versatile]MCL6316307.1 hypothetical protein [Pectobacterium atrosepticum]MCL6319457.1 hypothetical protein [Pectobacterium atrosepticum]CAG74564.1 hypothetical protein ECA1660 [Pectobacterium atrosepticum SCRI1043]